MISAALCAAAYLTCFVAALHSPSSGLAAVLGVGYLYGIIRANLPETYSHFIFDAAVLGLYVALFLRRLNARQAEKGRDLACWLAVLVAWPVLLFSVPNQDPFIRLVGLRGAIFFLPFLLIGARLDRHALSRLALWLAALNLMAFGFAVAEFFLGIERFFPRHSATELIHRSQDVAGFTAYRIPATFVSAAAYGGVMVASLPFLLGAWSAQRGHRWHAHLLVASLAASVLGVFLSAARTPAIVLFVLLSVVIFSIRLQGRLRLGLVVILLWVGWLVSSDVRLQRFLTLSDTNYVRMRIGWSVNKEFFELMTKYPLGYGLGAGGTSIPYFLQDRVPQRPLIESEYGRILLEQGAPGLAIWAAFILWVLSRRTVHPPDPWFVGRRLAWFTCATAFVTACLGTGLLTSIPGTCLLLLSAGWIVTPQTETAYRVPVLGRRFPVSPRRQTTPGQNAKTVRAGGF